MQLTAFKHWPGRTTSLALSWFDAVQMGTKMIGCFTVSTVQSLKMQRKLCKSKSLEWGSLHPTIQFITVTIQLATGAMTD